MAELKAAFPDVAVKLVHSSGGAFEVTLDGELIFSKLQLNRHARPGEIVGLVKDRVATNPPADQA